MYTKKPNYMRELISENFRLVYSLCYHWKWTQYHLSFIFYLFILIIFIVILLFFILFLENQVIKSKVIKMFLKVKDFIFIKIHTNSWTIKLVDFRLVQPSCHEYRTEILNKCYMFTLSPSRNYSQVNFETRTMKIKHETILDLLYWLDCHSHIMGY